MNKISFIKNKMEPKLWNRFSYSVELYHTYLILYVEIYDTLRRDITVNVAESLTSAIEEYKNSLE